MPDSASKKVILVVDDTPENIDTISALLDDDYKIKAATSGERALKVANGKTRPDLILLDIMMPGMDGFEVCRQLKGDPATSSIPVIFLSAKTGPEDQAKGAELGAVDFITKPIDPAELHSKVQSVT